MKALALEKGAPIVSVRKVGQKDYQRMLFKTHFIESGEDIAQVIHKYAGPHLKKGDILFVSDKTVSITQGRAYRTEEIKPSFLARFLSKFVAKTPHGIGLRVPERMEMAIKIAGPFKVIFAAIVAAITKVFGKKGVFYDILGHEIRGIDGHLGKKPPYYSSVILTADKPNEVAKGIANLNKCEAVVVDVNDLAGYTMGYSSEAIKDINFNEILRDNPMGQGNQLTPFGIIRPLHSEV